MNLERLLALVVVLLAAPQVFAGQKTQVLVRVVGGVCFLIAAWWLLLQWLNR